MKLYRLGLILFAILCLHEVAAVKKETLYFLERRKGSFDPVVGTINVPGDPVPQAEFLLNKSFP